MKKLSAILFLTAIAVVINVSAQTSETALKPVVMRGEIINIEAVKSRILLKTFDGEIVVSTGEKTIYKRVSPDNTSDLKAASAAAQTDIGAGDQIVAVGILSNDKKSLAARSVYLLTKGDIAKKQAAEKEKWANATAGKVTAVNTATNEISVSVRNAFGAEKIITIAANDKTQFRRYARGSIKYSEAEIGSFAELQAGDQLRARGEKTSDGSRLVAEEIISGAFKTVAGTITAIDATKREITIKEILTNKILTIAISNDALPRRFPAETAQRLAKAQTGQASSQTKQENGTGDGGSNSGDVDRMLEQMPALQISELKVGDAIAASGTATDAPDRVTAVKFIAGIEPFLKPLLGAKSQGNQRSAPSINIPGLDGAP